MKYFCKHFTLSELLVVITIICLLAGFLITALSQTLNRAKLAACNGNMRNIGNFVLLYCQDNSGEIPSVLDGMEQNSIPLLRLPGNNVLALGRLINAYTANANIFGCPDSPGYREEEVEELWKRSALVWSAYLYRGRSCNFSNKLYDPDNFNKPYIMDFACITDAGEQFAPHNYLAVNILYPDCHTESRNNTRTPFKLFTAQAASHGAITPDCTLLWQHADK